MSSWLQLDVRNLSLLRKCMPILCVLTSYLSFVSILNCIRYVLTLIIYHVVVNIITIVHIS